jgi:phosphatidylserine/phosphatidylglycerophosphate/cardiolipin synthase-like enzyme
MRRNPSLWALVILAYVAATLLLIPYAPQLLPHAQAPQTTTQAATELAAVPSDAPLSLIVEPRDTTAPLLAAINGAHKSIDLIIYELQDPAVEQALAGAKERGVTVRVILENLNSFGRHPNQPAYDFLQGKGVPVRWAPSYFPLTHQKTLIIDGSTAYILTFNLQPQYYASSRDFGLVDTDATDVAAIAHAFESDWGGTHEAAQPGRDLVWSPGSEPVLASLIAHATSTLDIYNEEMADPRITQALEAAAARGVTVRVVMTYATNWKPALNELTQHSVLVRTYASSAKFYIHAKAIVADGQEAFVGSENFSSQSLDQNRELGIVLTRPDIIAQLKDTFAHDYQNARPYTVRK